MKQAAFEEFVEQYQRLAYTICYQLTRNHHTAEDLAQDTFVSAYTHWDSCPADNPKAWLARIATNKAKDHLKSAWSRRVGLPGADALPEDGCVMAAAEPAPEEAVLAREAQRSVGEAISALREPYRQVAGMSLLADRSVAEIADTLARPRKTVQTQLFRARAQLRGALQHAVAG